MAVTAVSDELFHAVRNNLDISWVDYDADKKLRGIIIRGMAYLNRAAGVECDYSVEAQPRELLMEYCRYARSGALDEFQQNYLHELISLQMNTEVPVDDTE